MNSSSLTVSEINNLLSCYNEIVKQSEKITWIDTNYKKIIYNQDLLQYFLYTDTENITCLFYVSWNRQDIGILKKIELAGYAPYKTQGNYFNTAVCERFYKNLKFITENDCRISESASKYILMLLKEKKYKLIESIIDNSDNRTYTVRNDILDIILSVCSKEDIPILQKILEKGDYLNSGTSRILILTITTNNSFVFLYVVNYLLQKKIQLPDIDYRIIFSRNFRMKKFNEVFYLALEFDIFYKSLYENRILHDENMNTNTSRNFGFDEFGFGFDEFGFNSCPLEEKYINYCIEKKIASISDLDCVILRRLLESSKIELFYKLFNTYRSEISDMEKQNIIEYIYENRKTLFSNNYIELIETVFKNSNINFSNSTLFGYSDNNTRVVDLVGKNNLPLIKLFVEHKIDINTGNGHLLRRAIYRNYTDIIRYLLSLPDIVVNKTHFTKRQYSYLDKNNKLDEYIVSLFKKYNPASLSESTQDSNYMNTQLMIACCQKNNKNIRILLQRGADILSLGCFSLVSNHPIYKNNDLILEEYARKYFAIKRITRILFGRRGIVHDIRYKLGRRRIFQEFIELEKVINV